MATAHRLLTYEGWLHLPAQSAGADEVVKGELHSMPPTQYPQAEIIQRLIRRFDRQVDEKRVAKLGSNFGLMITRDPLTCRSPDLALYWRDKIVIEDGLYWSPPDLAIEVLSPSETKRRKNEKLEDYAATGVPEAWLISPEAQSVEVRLLAGGKLVTEAVLVEGLLRPSRFPGVTIPVTEIWPEQPR